MSNKITDNREIRKFVYSMRNVAIYDIVGACMNKFSEMYQHESLAEWYEAVSEIIDELNSDILKDDSNKRGNNGILLRKYIKSFQKLKVSNHKGYEAPHKRILLLAILSLIEEGSISTSVIRMNENLKKRFEKIWKTNIVGDVFKPNVCMPFWYMKSEPFWKLYSVSDKVDIKSCSPIMSFKRASEVLVAEIDYDLFMLMKNSNDRTILKRELESFQKDFSEARDEDLGMLKDSEIARTNKVRRYSLDDETFFCKRRFALEVVRQLVRHYPNRSFEFYESLVPERVESGSILVPENVWQTKSEDGKSRFFCAEGEGFVDCHGLRFFVSNQWTGEMIEEFIVPVVKALGYTIYRKY